MTDRDTVSASIAVLGASGWAVSAQNARWSYFFDAAGSFVCPRTGLWWVYGCGGGGGGGNGEAAAGGGGGGGGGGGRAVARWPLWINQGETVVVSPGAGGAANTDGGTTQITVGGIDRIRIQRGGAGGNGAAGVGGGGGLVGGSFLGASATAAGANSTYRSQFPGMTHAGGSTGSGGGHTGLSAGIANVLAEDVSQASTGQSGGGHGGTTPYGLERSNAGLGGAPGVSGSAPAEGNFGGGGGGGGAAASPGVGAAGHRGMAVISARVY